MLPVRGLCVAAVACHRRLPHAVSWLNPSCHVKVSVRVWSSSNSKYLKHFKYLFYVQLHFLPFFLASNFAAGLYVFFCPLFIFPCCVVFVALGYRSDYGYGCLATNIASIKQFPRPTAPAANCCCCCYCNASCKCYSQFLVVFSHLTFFFFFFLLLVFELLSCWSVKCVMFTLHSNALLNFVGLFVLGLKTVLCSIDSQSSSWYFREHLTVKLNRYFNAFLYLLNAQFTVNIKLCS